jgi:hypothetical protein
MRMSAGLDIDGTDYLWSLGLGEYKMEVAQPRVPKGGARGAGSSRGPPRMPCSSGPTSVARSVRTGYMSAATSFASSFWRKKIFKQDCNADDDVPKRGSGEREYAKRSGLECGEVRDSHWVLL